MGEVVLAACRAGSGILATDLRSGAQVATFDECVAQPNAFGMLGSTSGQLFAANSKKALWHVWNWGEKKPRYRGSLPEKITAMTFSQDAALCIGGSASGSLYVWQAGTGSLLRSWPAHCREVTQVTLSQDESFLVSSSGDATVHLYNLADIFAEPAPKPLQSWSGHALPVTSVCFLPQGSGLQQAVATASLDQSVRIWDVGTGRPLMTRSLAAPVYCMSAKPGGSEILCACKDGELRSFSTSCAPGASEGVFTGHTGGVTSCAFSLDGSLAASCSDVDCVRIWETRTRQCVAQAHSARTTQIGAVQIVQRAARVRGLFPLQPLQRLLQRTEELPAVPVMQTGMCPSRETMEAHANVNGFIDRVVWGKAAGGDLSSVAELAERCAVAEANLARWAAVASDLYGHFVDTGVDAPVVTAAAKKPRSDLNAKKSSTPATEASVPLQAGPSKERLEPRPLDTPGEQPPERDQKPQSKAGDKSQEVGDKKRKKQRAKEKPAPEPEPQQEQQPSSHDRERAAAPDQSLVESRSSSKTEDRPVVVKVHLEVAAGDSPRAEAPQPDDEASPERPQQSREQSRRRGKQPKEHQGAAKKRGRHQRLSGERRDPLLEESCEPAAEATEQRDDTATAAESVRTGAQRSSAERGLEVEGNPREEGVSLERNKKRKRQRVSGGTAAVAVPPPESEQHADEDKEKQERADTAIARGPLAETKQQPAGTSCSSKAPQKQQSSKERRSQQREQQQQSTPEKKPVSEPRPPCAEEGISAQEPSRRMVQGESPDAPEEGSRSDKKRKRSSKAHKGIKL